MSQYLKIAHLDEAAVARLRTLEEATGKQVMAFAAGPPFAELSADHLALVQELEQEMGVLLLVFDA